MKIWPGHAASSMPCPTKPASSGSWPLPPPEMRTTFERAWSRRRRNVRLGDMTTISECAAENPSNQFATSVLGEFMNFFIWRTCLRLSAPPGA